MTTFRVISYDDEGDAMRDFSVSVEDPDGPAFIAHQVLHADGVVCVQILDTDDVVLLRQCDPGLEFDSVVGS